MSIDPRRSGAALWAVWVAASALGGGLATLLPLAGVADFVNGSSAYDFILAYFAALAAIASLFQSLVLIFVAPGRRAALLWLPATLLGASLLFSLLNHLLLTISTSTGSFFYASGTMSPILGAAYEAAYPLTFGLAQGLVLTLLTRRKAALAVWLVGNLLALPATHYFAHLTVGGEARGTTFIVSNAIFYGAYAVVTGVALLLIVRLGRHSREPLAPKVAPALEGQG
jgi:hypothetical protein